MSGYQLEQAMAVLMSVRHRLLQDDPHLVEDEKLFSDMLEGESGDAMDVLHKVLRAAVRAESLAYAAGAMADDMTERRDRFSNRAKALRGAAFTAMDALGLPKLELPDMTASIKRGQPHAVVTNEDALPDRYVRITRSPNKGAITADLKAGIDVPGAELTNGLGSLQIRTK